MKIMCKEQERKKIARGRIIFCTFISILCLFGLAFATEGRPATAACDDDPTNAGHEATQEDVENGFRDYAEADSQYVFPNIEGQKTVNVVGDVCDIDSGYEVPLAGVKVVVGELTLITDHRGRFQIKNMPAGKYDWHISAAGYKKSTCLHWVAEGETSINVFYISKEKEFLEDKEAMEKEKWNRDPNNFSALYAAED